MMTTSMRLMRNALIVALACITPAGSGIAAFGQTPSAIEQFRKLQAALRQTHAAGNAAGYLANAQLLHEFLNGSPNSVLQLASAEAFAGKNDDALHNLTEFARMGQANEAALQAKQFDAVRGSPQYSNFHDAMVANTASVTIARRAFSLPGTASVPEDIDFDSVTKLFYVTSVLDKKILEVYDNGRTRLFAKAPDNWPMMAIKIDARRRLLWATEVSLDGFTASPHEDWGRSAVLIYDLTSGRLLHRVEGPAHTALADMTLTADGDAIVSDGDNGGVYRVSRADLRIMRLDAGDFISPQTPAMLPDGLHALVPDYLRGIGVLDLKTKKVAWIPTEGAHALSGIDGLYLYGHTLVATQNGTSPERVVRFELDASFFRVVSESIVERGTATLGDPTHGVFVGGTFFYIANSGWDVLDEHGTLKPGAALPEALIMGVDLIAQQERHAIRK